MESSDREILLRIEGRVIRLEAEQKEQRKELEALKQRVGNIEATVAATHDEVIELRTASTMTLWTIGIGFAVLAAVVTFVGVYVPHMLNKGKEEKSSPAPVYHGLSAADVITIVRSELRSGKGTDPA